MMKQNRILRLLCTLSFLLVWGCARIPVREISDARVLMEAAKSSCSRVYMPEEMKEVKKNFALIDEGTQKKNRKSKKELRRLALEVQSLSKKMITETSGIKSEIYTQIQQEIISAIKKIHEGEKAEANRYARKEYKLAIQSVREARQISQDECRYKEALEKAGESFQYAEQSIQRAAAFKKELESKLPVYHIVKKGETLKSIAKNSPLYRDEAYWEVIYKANRDQIGDPGILYTGQQLYLPGKEEIKKNNP